MAPHQGLVAVISRRGEEHIDAIGATALSRAHPMRPDTIFPVSSMTKPVTAVAAMMLLEECVLRLDDPVDRLLPELAGRRVVRRIDGPSTTRCRPSGRSPCEIC